MLASELMETATPKEPLSPEDVFGAVRRLHSRCSGGYATVAMVSTGGIIAPTVCACGLPEMAIVAVGGAAIAQGLVIRGVVGHRARLGRRGADFCCPLGG